MGSNKYIKRRRRRLMEISPLCHWCRRLLVLPEKRRRGVLPEDFPTLDHLKSRLFGQRRDVGMKKITMVLACPACNIRRQQEDHARHIWVTRWRSASFPRYLEFLNHWLRLWRGCKKNEE